jgi:chitinase
LSSARLGSANHIRVPFAILATVFLASACADDASTERAGTDAGSGGVAGAQSAGGGGFSRAGTAGISGAGGQSTPAGGAGTNSGSGGARAEPDASGAGGSGGTSAGGAAGADARGTGGAAGGTPTGFMFGPYKDTSINMNWNTNVISTNVSGTSTPLAGELAANGARAVTLAFATGECGTENWAGVSGSSMASANVALLEQAGIKFIVSTGGAAGSFTCATDVGFETFLGRWASPNLVGVDFDIEAGQSPGVIGDLVQRLETAHAAHPALRFSLTLATLASNDGAATAHSMGSSAEDNFNTYGDTTMAAVRNTLGFTGPSTWPSYLTVNLMTMDYGSPSKGVCVVDNGACQMGESALQAAYNLHDKWGVPYAGIEITPMIGRNDVMSESFLLSDVDRVATFAMSNGLAGIHYWSYDRDTDCDMTSASPVCNSMGSAYAGPLGYLKRFVAAGLH